MFVPRLVLSSLLFLSPLTKAIAGSDPVAAAVTMRVFDTELRFEDGAVHERHFRRAGIEYWEGVTEHVYVGFGAGYSDSEGREAARPFETASGNYGFLGLRVDAPLAKRFSLRARTAYLFQRDRRGAGEDEFETRLQEVRVELGPALHVRRLDVSLGARWRELDYRDIDTTGAGEAVRHAEESGTGGGFAALGLQTRDGVIALRYDAGAEQGWSLRFERTF